MKPQEKAKELTDFLYFEERIVDYDGINRQLMQMYEWAIEMAYEWWEKEFDIMNMQFHDSKVFYQNKLDNFKKAMEEQL